MGRIIGAWTVSAMDKQTGFWAPIRGRFVSAAVLSWQPVLEGEGRPTMDKIQMNALLTELKAGAALASGSKTSGTAPAGSLGRQPVDFSALLRGTLDQVNDSQKTSQALAREFQLGNPKVSLEDTMVALQKSSLSFQFLVQVRNKVVSAYNDIMNMQV
jgi:flagellar hook-basal body complex protein FliE